MQKEIMICGIDCKPGDGNCNNYCNHDTSKSMADSPPSATNDQIMLRAINRAKIACDKAEAEVEELRITHNVLFAEGIVAGIANIAESCSRNREKLKLLISRKGE